MVIRKIEEISSEYYNLDPDNLDYHADEFIRRFINGETRPAQLTGRRGEAPMAMALTDLTGLEYHDHTRRINNEKIRGNPDFVAFGCVIEMKNWIGAIRDDKQDKKETYIIDKEHYEKYIKPRFGSVGQVHNLLFMVEDAVWAKGVREQTPSDGITVIDSPPILDEDDNDRIIEVAEIIKEKLRPFLKDLKEDKPLESTLPMYCIDQSYRLVDPPKVDSIDLQRAREGVKGLKINLQEEFNPVTLPKGTFRIIEVESGNVESLSLYKRCILYLVYVLRHMLAGILGNTK